MNSLYKQGGNIGEGNNKSDIFGHGWNDIKPSKQGEYTYKRNH